MKTQTKISWVMGYNAVLKFTMIFSTVLLFFNCSKSDDNSDPPIITHTEGTMQELRDFYNDDFVDAMIAIGFDINLGKTPPNLEGTYKIEPFILNASTVPSDANNIGHDFGAYLPSFSNQNNSTLTLDYFGQGEGGGQTDTGNGSFVMGSNGSFSVFVKTTTTLNGGTAVLSVAISGVLTANGIENIQFLGSMLDDRGDPNNTFIANNTGRLLIDGNGLASVQ